MKNVEQITHNKKTITIINLQGATPATLPTIINEAQKIITAAPPISILSLTDATGFTFNKESAELLKTYSEKIIPNVKASCVVGADDCAAFCLPALQIMLKKKSKALAHATKQ